MTPEFRAWDKKNEIYLYNVQYAYDTLSGFVKYDDGKNATYDESCFGDFLDNKRYDTEQFTGLKDVNGNKIFEGDILKLSYDDPKTYLYTDEYDYNPKIIPPKTVTRTVKVINEKGAFRVIALHIKLYGTRLLCDVDQGRENIEIIGNVHENPELLEAGE